MTTVTLRLGDFTFANFEVPEKVGFGGEQELVVHKLIGGIRVVDAMGPVPQALEWSGYLTGATALDRALFLDGLRKAGTALALTWSELSFTVVIRSFHCDFLRSYRLAFSISCEVVEDKTRPVKSASDPIIDSVIASDASNAQVLTDAIDDDTLSTKMTGLAGAIAAISDFAAAAQNQIDAVLTPLREMRDQVDVLIRAADATIANVASVGGILPNNPIARQVAGLTSQIAAIEDQGSLLALDRTLGRLQANLGSLNAGTSVVTVAGGNLLALAATEYRDVTGWTAIARANGLDDPEIIGIAALAVPPYTNPSGGILRA